MALYNGMNISLKEGTNQDDNLVGTGRSEVISGAGGDDRIQALSGNDEVFGGTGNDILYGQGGNDIIYGNGKPKYVDMADLRVTHATEATVTFMDEGAGFRNALGVYEINDDGSFSNVQILFSNTSKVGSGGELIPGQSNVSFDVSEGARLGFFVVSNAYGKGYLNREALSAQTGHYDLRNLDGEAGNISDQGVELYHVDPDAGTVTAIQSQYGYALFHSVGEASDDYRPNPDEFKHVVGRASTVSGEVLIGFEDLYGGGDKDFDDAVISVHIGQQNVVALLPPPSPNATPKPDDDIINGGDGNDTLYGMGGDDIINGGAGNDAMHGNSGNDIMSGNDGNDTMNGNSGNDDISGGDGNDIMAGNSGDDVVSGNSGADELSGNSGNDKLDGGSGNDRVDGGSGDDEVYGGSGSDVVLGGSGTDYLNGGSGNDTISAGSGDDHLLGGSGRDTLNGNSGDDLMEGGAGSDTLNGHSGDDTLLGGTGGDRLVGGGGHDSLDGGGHNDRIYGGSGDDVLEGGSGNDYLTGGSGDDALSGGLGKDKLIGGSGSDQFIFKNLDGDIGKDTIYDFSINEDTLLFSGFDMQSLEDLLSSSIQQGSNVKVELSDTECVYLRDCELNQFNDDMALFV